VSKRLVDIDDDLLKQATELLGTSTMKETVNQALQEVVSLKLRLRFGERLATMRGLDLDKPEIMARAWRR